HRGMGPQASEQASGATQGKPERQRRTARKRIGEGDDLMDTDEVIAIFRETGAVLEGHFILTSGLRSPVFLQKARVFMHADKTERLCKALAEKIRAQIAGPIDY